MANSCLVGMYDEEDLASKVAAEAHSFGSSHEPITHMSVEPVSRNRLRVWGGVPTLAWTEYESPHAFSLPLNCAQVRR